MNLKQYYHHLVFWLKTFPLFNKDEHMFFGPVGSPTFTCIVKGCDAVQVDDDTPQERDEHLEELREAMTEDIEEINRMLNEEGFGIAESE